MKLPHITNKQQELIELVYQFRFANRIQLQAFIHHNDYKQINIWLKDLVTKQYLVRIYSTKFGESCKPAIYYIGRNGIKWLASNIQSVSLNEDDKFETKEEFSDEVWERWYTYIKRLYKDKTRSKPFIDKSILLAEIYKKLIEHEEQWNKDNINTISYGLYTSSQLFNHNKFYNALYDLKPYPSAYIYKGEKKGTKTKYNQYLLEIIDDTMPRFAIRSRIKAYIRYYFSGEWENQTDLDFPRILIVCPSKSIFKYLKRKILQIWEEESGEDIVMYLAVRDEVQTLGIQSQIWTKVQEEDEDE